MTVTLRRKRRAIYVMASLAAMLLVLMVMSMNSGKISLTPLEVLKVLLGGGTEREQTVVMDFRLPRIILAILVGIGMSLAGCVMQTLLRNDMASPGTLGISAGSGFFVLLYIVLFSTQGMASAFAMPVLSFVGGLTAAALIFLLAYRRGRATSPTSLILTGVALGSGYGAASLLLTLKLDENQLNFVLRWSAGSLWGTEWRYLIILAPWVLVFSLYIFYKSRILDSLQFGHQVAAGLGVSVKREFLLLAVASIALASGSVSLGGNFFFIGLITPHMARKLVGTNHKYVLPVSCLIGAVVVLLADTITRTISFGADVPAGIVITVLSTPYFLYLIAKAN
ncbi:FecCD family ABC transporter permease [Paenibacillus sinopodophylli]|uniref:FecCD family ABC transporter permease n=1 Tax=Paenibacillus sinopodophylli TaxID=1837342 RepID=UPI00110D24CB|nr:iron ABC transporter permease [Paenibacillus sinopodophylli]